MRVSSPLDHSVTHGTSLHQGAIRLAICADSREGPRRSASRSLTLARKEVIPPTQSIPKMGMLILKDLARELFHVKQFVLSLARKMFHVEHFAHLKYTKCFT